MNRIIYDIRKYGGYAIQASKAQLKAEVANSKLNWIWWILEPFCYMLVYSFVFGVLFNSREQYHNLFVFVGLSIWQFFSKCIKHSVTIIKKKKTIISRIYMPKYILLIQEIYVNAFKLGICLFITLIMMIYYRVGITSQIVLLLPLLSSLSLFCFGLSCFVLHYGVFFEDLSNIVDIVLKLLVYFVGVFFSIPNRFPEPYNELLVKWNPIAFFVDSGRKLLLYHQPMDYQMLFFWTIIGILLSYAGIQLIYRNENSYIKVI